MKDPLTVRLAGIVAHSDGASALELCSQLLALQAAPSALAHNDAADIAISVVVPIFNEAENLPELHSRLCTTLAAIGLSYEVVFVDDCSLDNSAELIAGYAELDSRIVLVRLARNFGHQAALSAGIDLSRGNVVVLMDGDLQDPPEAVPQLLAGLKEGYDVVYALRWKRKEGQLKKICYSLFYRALNLIADIKIPPDAGDFCAMSQRVANQLRSMPERQRFLRGIRSWIGFPQKGIVIERGARFAGKPKYTWAGLVSLALNGLISFSMKPLRLISILGVLVSCSSLVLALVYAIKRLTTGLGPPGFATIVVLIAFFAGVQLITLGLIGEYVGRIFEESKRRPLYVLKEIIRGK